MNIGWFKTVSHCSNAALPYEPRVEYNREHGSHPCVFRLIFTLLSGWTNYGLCANPTRSTTHAHNLFRRQTHISTISARKSHTHTHNLRGYYEHFAFIAIKCERIHAPDVCRTFGSVGTKRDEEQPQQQMHRQRPQKWRFCVVRPFYSGIRLHFAAINKLIMPKNDAIPATTTTAAHREIF